MAILVVDDDSSVLRTLRLALEARDLTVVTATTGREALDLATADDPDVVVLDLGLPDMDGVEVCRHLRRWSTSPVIVLTADGDEARMVQALDEGADDYLTKPFSMPALMARIRVALRHRQALAAVSDARPVQVGDLVLDTEAHEARVGRVPLELTPKEFGLLLVLARNTGKVMTHGALLRVVWGPSQSMDTLRTHVASVRRKLGAANSTARLETAPGIGYRLMPPVATA